MTAFLEQNQDYLLFITGLAFAQAGLVAHALGRVEHQPAWRWFGWFAFTRAFASWLSMVPLLDLGASDLLETIGTLAQGVSTILLLEFARSLTAIRHHGRPGRWVHLLLLAGAGGASTILPHDALSSVHLLLTPIAGLWASYTLWLLQRNTAAHDERRRWKGASAVLIAATSGLSAAALFHETTTISSLVLVNTALACLVAMSIGWCYSLRAQHTLATVRIPGWRNRRALWLLAAVSIIVLGWITAHTAGHRRDLAMRQDALARCQLVAATVQPTLAHGLEWGESDLGKPAYQELKARMISLVKANHDLRFVLLAGVLDNQCYFLVDSEPPESEDYSPPGQLYTEASPDYVASMASRQPFVLGPVRDRWGTWIIASVPILDPPPGSDRGSINAEIDIAAGDWTAALMRERLPVAIIVLLILSLLLLAFHAQERIRQQMDNLALSEQRNTSLVEGSLNCIQMLDLDGRCLTVNHRGLVALGCPASTVIGRPFVELWPMSVRPVVATAMRETALGKPAHFEADYIRPDGRQIIWRVTTNPVRDTVKRVRSFVCICTDITESKNTERTLLAAKEAAEAADRAKSEFLAVMSHEIRTPLGGVIGMLDILQRQPQSPDQRRYTGMAHGSAEALLKILDDILDAAKVQSGHLHVETIAFRVQDEFLRVLEVMKLRAEAKKISLCWTFDPALPVALFGDPTRLRQVLANLLSNAIKFTATGGITASFHRTAEIGEKISLAIKVTDTGIGIPPEAIAKLFGKFVQADASTTRSYGGTGLGLSIVKGLIEQMGGTVSVESTPGKGTTFSAQIPLAVASEDQLVEIATSLHDVTFLPPHARTLRLLCAEDDAVQRAIAESQALEMGHTITFAFNGAAALEKLRHADFDAVLMDNRMPVMDGFQATRAIRAGEGGVRQPLIPIIAITANASIAYRDECLAVGMNDFLTKPLRRADFHRALADVIHASFAASNDETIVPAGLTEAELLSLIDESPDCRPMEEPVSPKIAALFFEETPGRFAEMHAALKQKDAPTFARAAHSVKSTALYIHARQLSEIAAQLEKLADACQFEALPAPLTQAETLFAGLLARHPRDDSNTAFSAT